MTTLLDKELKRQISLDGADYIVAIDPERMRLTSKGHRKPEVELRWHDLLTGAAALAVALNASLQRSAPAAPATAPQGKPARKPARKPAPKKRAR
jgi:hypothetical protein